MPKNYLLAAAIGFAVAYSAPIDFTGFAAGTPIFAGIGTAKAQNPARNTARRTARRTTRRVNRRQSVAGCAPYNAYYNCGGVYYRPVVENGVTVYVVVNP
ncbi:hypothetical protein [Roseibium sp. Sym1]|uniref:hypothetical protein n=1 Tax=Roseibium sp. Sym1 TaxID=3016006 RepID=UPI0022B378FF|nr:hypothetical protein [Roseibium sp. Sym1]